MIRISQLSLFSQFKMLLIYHYDTHRESSGEFVKFVGKQPCRSLFFNKVAGRLKKRIRHGVLEEPFRKTALNIRVFYKQFFTSIPEIIGSFRESFIFQIIGLFLLFMSGF